MTEQFVASRWILAGRVQGVGFRWSAQRQGRQLGLKGWVRNLPDGRVEVVAKGTPQQLVEMEGFLRAGPPPAYVENVEKTSIPHEDISDNPFTIK